MTKKKIPSKFKIVLVVSRKDLENWSDEKVINTRQARKIIQEMVNQNLYSF